MYQLANKKYWQGRIDTEDGTDGLRWHQAVQILDASSTPLHKAGADLNIAFLGFCSDEGVRRNKGRIGAQGGPDCIRKSLASLPVHFSSERVSLFDAGNVICPSQNLESTQQLLGDKVAKLLEYGFFPIVLGGGHEVAYGHYLGLHKYTKETIGSALGIINLDAHFDLRSYSEQSSSGTPFRQIWDLRKHHELRFNYLCLGIQEAGNTQALFKQAKNTGTNYLLADELSEMDTLSTQSYLNRWLSEVEGVYLTLDLDVYSADAAPGVSTVNPFGLSTQKINQIITAVVKSGKLISMDIAELNPLYDLDNRTAKLAAWQILKVVQQLASKPK
jgi:formiminoglutamase